LFSWRYGDCGNWCYEGKKEGLIWSGHCVIGAILIFLAGCKGFWAVLGIILIFLGLAIYACEENPSGAGVVITIAHI
jgi:uncharacterized membrane protein